MLDLRPVIALDADGVLLHYNKAYGSVWTEHFAEQLSVVDPTAYHATTYWGVSNPSKDHPFWELFTRKGWRNMEAMDGALEACRKLHEAGYRLVCVTSMPEDKRQDRFDNLIDLGFPIDEVIATGSKFGFKGNPKKEAIEALQPLYFVDDELRKLKDLPDTVHCVLVDPDHSDSPNVGQDDSYLTMRVSSLLDFAERLLAVPHHKNGLKSVGC